MLCFIFYFIFLHCPLSGPVLTYISLLIIPCMIVYHFNTSSQGWYWCVTSVEQRGRMMYSYLLITFIVMFWIDLEGLLYKYLSMKVYFSEKDVFFYFNRERLPPNVTFIVNICLIMGKHHIHKQKWTKRKLNFLLFQIDMKHYIELQLGLKNSMWMICESFMLFVWLSHIFFSFFFSLFYYFIFHYYYY